MNKYYTAKDIEELAARGVHQLELGPGDFLTDFARETAQQFDITLVESGKKAPPASLPTVPSSTSKPSDRYNKPAACQHAASSPPIAQTKLSVSASQSVEDAGSNTVNRLVDLMGKVIKRGG